MSKLIDVGGVKIDPAKQLLELNRVEYEDSLYEFLKAAWPLIAPAQWRDGWPVEAVAEHLQAVVDGDIKRLIINIPPRMGKSNITSVALPAWTWAQPDHSPTSGPGVAFLHASYAMKLSRRDAVKCRRLIMSNWYQSMWGNRFTMLGDQNAVERFGNSGGGERLITSIGSATTGEGGSIIVIDDPNAADEAHSEATIESTIEWWDGTMSTRLNDAKTGAYIVIQQRLAEDDLTGHIMSKDVGEWTHLMLPMKYEMERHTYTSIGWHDPRGLDRDGTPLVHIDDAGVRTPVNQRALEILKGREGALMWPDRFGVKEVSALERSLGPWGTSGQLQQRPAPQGGGIIKREWWKLWDEPLYPPMDYILGVVDTAYTEKEMNDPSAMTVWGVFTSQTTAAPTRALDHNGRPVSMDRQYMDAAPKVMLLHAWTDRLEFHGLVEKVNKTAKSLKCDKIIIENKASGISVAQEMRRVYSNEGYGVQLSDPKSLDKMARLHSVVHLFADGMVYAPDRPWAEEVFKQVGQFPKAKHDDLVDTVSAAIKHLRDMGLLQRAPERLDELEAGKAYRREAEPLYPG